MSYSITKAMVLAAGLGTRLRPLTYKIPKPLLPLNSHTLIDYCLLYLVKGGIREVMINIHHLGRMIRDHVGDGSRYGLKASYSEEPVILGTGGGIKNAESFFEDKPFVCINSDSLTNADLNDIVKRHFETEADATMVLKKLGPNDSFETVELSKEGLVKGFGGSEEYFYTGLQIIGPKLLKLLPAAGEVSCLIKDGYQKLIDSGGKVSAYLYDGYFSDLGTPERYEQTKRDIKEDILNF